MLQTQSRVLREPTLAGRCATVDMAKFIDSIPGIRI
jgi:hypothetical protein